MNNFKMLVADDDAKIRNFLAGLLTREGFRVATAADGYEVLEKVEDFKPGLIILDVMMPKLDGFDACRKIREHSKVPIIFLSAKKNTLDKVLGLSLGCDDYLAKPFDSTELILRIKAVIRRYREGAAAGAIDEVIEVPGLKIDRGARLVKVNGKTVKLTAKEFDLLYLLAGNPSRVFTRDQIIYYIWDSEFNSDTSIVTTLVKRLREKIELNSAEPVYVRTVRGVGYKFGV